MIQPKPLLLATAARWLRIGVFSAAAIVTIALPIACAMAPLTLDIEADRIRLSATDPTDINRQSTVVHANASGGSEPYNYVWTVKDPMGQTHDELLDDISSSDPTFHPGQLIGPYLLTCTVRDTILGLYTDTIIIYASQDLGLSLSVDRKEVPSGGGANGQVEVKTETWGGAQPYTYTWSVLGPNGEAANDRLSGEGNTSRMFTSGDELGTYRIACKVTDGTGAFTSETTEVIVNHLLSVNISSDRPIVTPGGGQTGLSTLMADASGGKTPYMYTWTMLGPDGREGQWLDGSTTETTVFTSPVEPGTYRAVCTVQDARGDQIVGSMLILVSQQLSVSVSTNRQRVSSEGGRSGQAVLKAFVLGGTTGYTYKWTVVDPDDEDSTARLDDRMSATPTFTSDSVPGTYQVFCEVTDGVGQVAADSLEIIVGQPLAVEVTVNSARAQSEGGNLDASSDWVASGGGTSGQATVSAEVTGGSPPYTYAWSVVGPDGQPAPDRLSGSSPNTRFFRSEDTLGIYTITCIVSDATGMSVNDSAKVVVYDRLTLDLTTDHVQMPANGGPAGRAHPQAVVTGGTPDYEYTWTITGPDGIVDNSLLDDATIANPLFTTGSKSGIYRVECTVQDSVGQTLTDTLLFMVGQPVTLDVVLDRTDVIAGGGTAHLYATASGGIPDYSYSWDVTTPAGIIDNSYLDDTQIATPTFTSALATGTFSFTCTVTDAAGFIATLSTSLVVGGGLDQGLSVTITTQHEALPAPASQSSLYAIALGGVEPVSFEWKVIDPNGAAANSAISDPAALNPVFTAPSTIGTYRISCTVMDSVLKRFTDSIQIYVGMPLSVDLQTDKLSIPATGGQATLSSVVGGGISPYTYVWTATNPTGGDAAATLGSTTAASTAFTAPATAGTYRFTCTARDAHGTTVSKSIQVYVGMRLSVDVTAVRQSLPSSETTTLNAAAQGGISSYGYAWSVTDPSGADASASLSATDVANPTFTAPATAGTYRATCTVQDSANETFVQSIHLYVGMPLTLDVQTDKVTLPAVGNTAALTAVANGGASNYTYVWTATDPSGGDASAALSSTTTASPTFTAPAGAGTYGFTCTVTDGDATKARASLQVYVGMGLSLNVTAAKQSLPSGQTTTVNAAVQGGLPTYSYTWSVLTPSGASDSSSLSATNVAGPTFTAPSAAGTYRVSCTAKDAANETVVQTIHVYVGMPLTLDVRTDKLGIPATGGQASLLAIAKGGVSPYVTYAWTALDPTGGNANGTLSSTSVDTPLFTAPVTAGTYRFTCTVTDTAGTTASASLEIYVGMRLSVDVTAVRQSLPSGQTTALNAAAHGGISSYGYTWSVLDASGADVSASLSATNVADPTFTAPATAGTYRATCTVKDSADETISATLHILVGMPLSIDVLATKASIPATGGTTTIAATTNGGLPSYTYAWTATDPSGANAAASLSSTTNAAITFTAPATAGTYRFVCTATDATGATFRDSTSVYVGMNLSLDVSATRQSLPNGQITSVAASAQGGFGTPTYAWIVLDPSGASATTALSSTTAPTVTFTAPTGVGTYRLICTVTDGAGETIRRSIMLNVGTPLTLDVRTNKLSIPATGGQATLLAIPNGGASPYTAYAWSALDPVGASAAASLSSLTAATTTFTAPATAGTYQFTCTVTDTAGTTVAASLEVCVGMNLALDLTAVRQSLPSTKTTTITAAVQGGIPSYAYVWSALSPTGADASAALNTTDPVNPTFTAPAGAGTYRVTCTVTDSANETIARSIHLVVGMPLTVDVQADRVRLPATGDTATLTAVANGGVSPYVTYSWAATNPSGGDASAALDDTTASNPVFTAPAAAGTYQFACTVTDTAGTTAIASLQVYVGMGLSVDVTASKVSLPSTQTCTLNASAQGGIPTYSYTWSVLTPSGASDSSSLSATNVAGPTFTAPAAAGTYRVTCTVEDAAHETVVQTIAIYVGMPLTLDVRTDKLGIPATGGQAALSAVANGGTSGYTYVWTATDPSGASAAATLSGTAVASPTFTAPATAGTYRFTCTVHDNAGMSVINSVQVYVGMRLSLDVTANRQNLPGGQLATLHAAAQGGISGYSYVWSALSPSGANASAALNTLDPVNPTFTAPVTAGTYRITCTVTDSASETFSQSILIYVGMPLTLDVQTDEVTLPATGGTATLTAAPNGGVSPYASYAWTVTDPSGGDASGALDDAAIAAPTFTAPAAAGTYQFTCTVTDSAGTTASNSLQVYVGMRLSVDLTTTRQSLPSGQSQLNAAAHGGIPTYAYTWSALDPSGADASAALTATNIANPKFTAPAAAGTYRVSCTVKDAADETVTQTIHIYVGMPLTVSVRTDKLGIPATGGQAALLAVANGGVSPYVTYAWTALDPSGGNAASALSSTSVAAPVFTAPATAGTYRFACTVTDTAGTTASASLEIYVGMRLAVDVTAVKQSLPSGQTTALNAAAHGGIPSYGYTWSVLDPDGVDASASLSATNVANPTFTAPATAGTYRATCTAQDAADETVLATLHILVGVPVSLDVIAGKNSIPAVGGTTIVTATASGGTGSYTYAWSATDPSGGNAAGRLSSLTVAAPTFTANATPGTYRLTCTVTDTAGATFRDSTSVYVGMNLSLDVSATKQSLLSGATTTVTASAQGGMGAYAYAWTVLDSSGASAAGSLSPLNAAAGTFTAPATAGTYRLTCTVTDAASETISRSIMICVGTPLTLDVTTQYTSIPAVSGQSALSTTVTGGLPSYTYLWSALSQTGASADAAISSLTSATPTFTAQAEGTYRVFCTVSDAAGASISDSCTIYVGIPLSACVLTTRTTLVSTHTAALSVVVSGGVTPYASYSWTALNPSGTDVTATVLTGATTASPTFTAPATVGTYRVTCTVTDARAATTKATVHVSVGMPLSADVTSTKVSLVAAATATLSSNASGGATPYSYAWTVTNSSGAGVPTSLTTPTAASTTFTAPSTPGTYRATCVVTDNEGNTFSDTVQILVDIPLYAVAVTGQSTLAAGETATLAVAPVGGTPGYTYSWAVTDPFSADATGRLNSTTSQTPIFTAPVAGGAYRATCTVTDAAGVTFACTVYIGVTTRLYTITAPAAIDDWTSPTSVTGSGNYITLNSQYAVMAVGTGGAGIDLAWPRNLQLRLADDGSVTGSFFVAVDGIDAEGHYQTEYFPFTNPHAGLPVGGGATTVQGTKVFSRVEVVRWVRSGTSLTPDNSDRLTIGVGNIFGLPRVISSAATVQQIKVVGGATLATPTDYTVITTPGSQGVSFTNASTQPNGVRSYQIYYDDE